MRYFPQLESRTAGQYPLRRIRRERVVRHESLDGRIRSYHDPAGARVEWRLTYQGCTNAERAAIENLFKDCEGRLQTFVFLDPAANLLRWSEDYTQPVWTRGPMLSLSANASDPWGTTRAASVVNQGAAVQALAQTIDAPGALQYCCSAFVKGSGSRFRLRIDSGGVIKEREFTASAKWERYQMNGQPGSNAETVTCSLLLDAGQAVDLCGMQLDAQIAMAGYRRTASRCGIYPNARFAEDALAWTQQAPNSNAAEIRIESRP
jgi:hypothetical protein